MRQDAIRVAQDLIAAIDTAVGRQVDAVLHHPGFQRLEAGWRSLRLLVDACQDHADVTVRMLSVSWRDLCRDLERAAEFDQSHLFRMVYSEEFGTAGGLPFGLMVCDYAVTHKLGPGHPTDDIAALQSLGAIAAASFCPFLLGTEPSLFGLDGFADLGTGIDPVAVFDGIEHARWQRLRAMEDMRFVGLTVPRMLLRLPYRNGSRTRRDGFPYAEDAGADGAGLLWGNAAFAFATVAVRQFAASGWFSDLRGVMQDHVGGGLVTGLPTYAFGTDAHGIAAQPPVEVRLTSAQEQALSDAGLIPLSAVPYAPQVLFNSNGSLHVPARYDRQEATLNARISSMLQYVLCAARFAHVLLVLMRDCIGGYADAVQVEAMLNAWISQYCLGNDDAPAATKAHYPLRAGDVEVRELPGRPGVLGCTMRLQPHFQLDNVATTFRLVTQVKDAA